VQEKGGDLTKEKFNKITAKAGQMLFCGETTSEMKASYSLKKKEEEERGLKISAEPEQNRGKKRSGDLNKSRQPLVSCRRNGEKKSVTLEGKRLRAGRGTVRLLAGPS